MCESQWITTRNGCRLLVRKHGVGRHGCILIHGYGEGSYVWDSVLSHLKGLSTFAIDLPGHGESGWEPDGCYDLLKYVHDVSTVIEALGLKELRLVGHSLGANIAMRIAASTDRVRRLVLVDFGPGIDPNIRRLAREHFMSQFRLYSQPCEYMAWLTSMRTLLSAEVAERVAGAVLRQRQDGQFEMKGDPSLARAENEIESNDADIAAVLRQIRCPTLLVRGSGSAVLSRAGAAVAMRCLRDARLVTVSKAGHGVMLDNPAEFAVAVEPFLGALS